MPKKLPPLKSRPLEKVRFMKRVVSNVADTIPDDEKNTKPNQEFFDEKWLAARWGCSVSYIRKLRYTGEGPHFTKFGTAVRYKRHDVQIFEKAQRVKSSSQRGANSKGQSR